MINDNSLDTLKSIANFMQICKQETQLILEKKIINENEIEKVPVHRHILFLLFQN